MAMAVKGRIAPAPRSRRREREPRPDELRRRVDPARLGFASTAEVPPLVGTIGQPRALDALEYGLAVGTRGFNLFVSGLPGSGRLTTVLDYVRTLAESRPAPSDWIYVHDFDRPDRPNAIRLPAGRGAELASAMDEFVEAVSSGKFHVWAVRTIGEGIEILTGRKVGRRRADGSYPPGSVHALVSARLAEYADRLREFAEPALEAGANGRPSPSS